MRGCSSCLAICIILIQGLAAAATVDRFEDGKPSATLKLSAPGCETVVNITLQASCRVLEATMRASVVPPMGGGSDFPEGVSVLVGDAPIWEFNYTDFGPLGRQDAFAGHRGNWTNHFGPGGGANSTTVRLPANAEVWSANVRVSGTGPRIPVEIASMAGNILYAFFGSSVSAAGDVNRDGYDDVIAGAPNAGMGPGNMETGYAGLFFGGQTISSTEYAYLKGPVEWGHMGVSVSGAGDVNGDGYDDVIVGADEYVANTEGHAYVFFGGATFDHLPDVTMKGESKFDQFGISVSGAGDINGDGYDDVIVGAKSHTSSFGYYAGRAYLFFGGPQMDNVPDLVLDGRQSSDFFGGSVSGTGDLNGDGYDDVVVGATGAYGVPNEVGYAAVFLGSRNPDSEADLVINGKSRGDALGNAVSGAGDLNGDGYDDLIIGALLNDAGGEDSGAVYVFFGAEKMDGVCDLLLKENASYDQFGASLSDAGDVNNDGYGDVIVGAPMNQSQGSGTGSAYLYFGGTEMDSRPDAVYAGRKMDEIFGRSVSGAGDVDRDGFNETFIGMPRNSTHGQTTGVASLFGWMEGLLMPAVQIAGETVWLDGGFFNGTATAGDFSARLDAFLQRSPIIGNDAYGNFYVDVPVSVSAAGEGAVTLDNLSIRYLLSADVADFSTELNDYLSAHRSEKDASGNLTVPVKVRSRTPGGVKLEDLRILTDDAPALIRQIPDFEMMEDTAIPVMADLLSYFRDDFDSEGELKLALSVRTNATIVNATLREGRYLSVDASEGPQNDNWTGAVEMAVTASDRRGSTTVSNTFLVIVRNVPDPPVITSVPGCLAPAGRPYSYQVAADDGDSDLLAYELVGRPDGMTVDRAGGLVLWTPSKMGLYNVSLAVSDGSFSVFQNFSIYVPNSPPRIANSTIPSAYTDSPYSHAIEAVDDNGDALSFMLLTGPEGLRIEKATGRIEWTPGQVGQFPVSVFISDGIDRPLHNFTIQVLQGNRAPVFGSQPAAAAITGVLYTYRPVASDPDGDALSFSLVKMPAGMVINASTGVLTWTPAQAGDFPVRLSASDGRGRTTAQEFSVRVTERVRPKVEFLSPAEGEEVFGRLTATGRAVNGSLDLVLVQFSIDDGPWTDAQGLGSWQFTVDTTGLKDGKHTLQARAFDGIDYTEPVKRTVLVDNAGRSGATDSGFGLVLVLATVIAAAVAGAAVYVWRKRAARTSPRRP